MERIKLTLPENFSFSTNIAVRITDINYGNHVGNDAFLSLIHEARMHFLLHHGYTELSFEGVGLIMADVAIEFKHELYYGNTVKMYVTADGFDKLGFDLFYKMTVEKNGKELIAAKAKTGMICFDYNAKRPVAIPQEAVSKLGVVNGES